MRKGEIMVESMGTPLHILRAGEFLMCALWLQSQMADFLILNEDKTLIDERMNNSSKIPQRMVEARAEYMKKQMSEVLKEFKLGFQNVLSSDDVYDLEKILIFRNMIAHSHVSTGRQYLLHVPNKEEKLDHIIKAFDLKSVPEQSYPTSIKLDFGNDGRFLYDFEIIKRIDEDCFARVANHIGISHSLIR